MENDTNINKEIGGAIVKTIVFFDIFDYPMTSFEIWKYLLFEKDPKEIRLGDIMSILESDPFDGLIEEKNGFYFLKGRVEILDERRKRYNFTDRKMKRALFAAKLFSFMPWIKMMAVANMIGSQNLRDSGDIDFFIITRKGRIWLTRLLCNTITSVLGLRPEEDNIKDKICLSFFATEDALDLRKLATLKFPDFDIYLLYWIAGLVPIYDKNENAESAYSRFIEANGWVKNYLPNWFAQIPSSRRVVRSGSWIKAAGGLLEILGRFENLARRFQHKRFPAAIRSKMNMGGGVIVNDRMLKFHISGNREDFYYKWKEKLQQY